MDSISPVVDCYAGIGPKGYNVFLILAWIIKIKERILSDRQLAEVLRKNDLYRFVTRDIQPAHNTFNTLRKRLGLEGFVEIHKRFVLKAHSLGLLEPEIPDLPKAYDRKRTKYACFKACQESEQMLPICDYLKEQYRFGYIGHTYFTSGYRKFGPALPHNAIYQKLKPLRTGIERTFGLVKENRYRMEETNFYKGIDNVTIHTVEHDIVLTQDIIFDYLTTGKKSPVLKFNF